MMSPADRTMKSLRKINDFPFYTAIYVGDYKSHDLRNGAFRTSSDVVPFFEDLFKQQGKPTVLTEPQPQNIGHGCSAFFCRNREGIPLVGKNNDWKRDPVILLKTSPSNGYASISVVDFSFCDVFKLGSFTHSLLFAPYVPLDGMNEKGLVVSTLSIHQPVDYPVKPDMPLAGEFHLVRLILDFCSNVEDAIATIGQFNVLRTAPLPIHILLADREECCVVEFFGGELHAVRDSKVSYMTNFLKLRESDYNQQRQMCNRYQVLEDNLSKRNGQCTKAEAMNLLAKVSVCTDDFQVPSTIWSIVCSPEELQLQIKVGDVPTRYVASIGNAE